MTTGNDIDSQPPGSDFELIVHVSTAPAAEAAINAGADAVYLSGEGFIRHRSRFGLDWLHNFVNGASQKNARAAVMMPHICDERDIIEWRHRLGRLSGVNNLAIGVSNLGCLQIARNMRIRDIIADFPLNVTNSVAADELSTMGADRITASIELSFEQLSSLAKQTRMPVEVVGQGPLSAMVLEHCIIAAATGDSPHSVCPMNCRKGAYLLRDTADHDYLLEPDRRCRNHIFTANDVCVLPSLSAMVSTGISGLRIEAQLDTAPAVGTVTGVYHKAIDSLRAGEEIDVDAALTEIRAATGRQLSDGPFDFKNLSTENKEQNLVRAETNRS